MVKYWRRLKTNAMKFSWFFWWCSPAADTWSPEIIAVWWTAFPRFIPLYDCCSDCHVLFTLKSYTIDRVFASHNSEMLYEVVRILRQIYNKFNRNIETSDMVCFVCGKEPHLKWRLALFLKNIQLFKNIFRQFFYHLQFWIIQSIENAHWTKQTIVTEQCMHLQGKF